METLPPPINAKRELTPIVPPPGAPDSSSPSAQHQAPAVPSRPVFPVSAVEFLDPKRREKDVPLQHPFLVDGVEWTNVRVRRLATFEVGAWRERVLANEADSYDLYAIMTGLPAPILRGLDAEDGSSIVAAAVDFLPRWLVENELPGI